MLKGEVDLWETVIVHCSSFSVGPSSKRKRRVSLYSSLLSDLDEVLHNQMDPGSQCTV